MNRLYLVVLLIAGAVAMPAVATGHDEQRIGGQRLVKAITQMDANNLEALFSERMRQFNTDKSENSFRTDKVGSHERV